MRFRSVLAIAVVATATVIAGCGGGGTTTTTPAVSATATPTPAPTATPTPAPNVLSANPNPLNFTSLSGTGMFTTTEALYTGAFTATSTGATSCTGIATFSPASGAGPNQAFTVTPVAAGTCTITVTDASGQKVNESVVVTTTTGTISSHGRN